MQVQKLIDGIHRFQKEHFLPMKRLFEKLADGQYPDTLFITCSDSRIDPMLLTNTQPGELFILRNAGNIIPPHGASVGGEAATIEFAVSSLRVKDIIICGHSHCGAMNALLNPMLLKELPSVASWLVHAETTRRIVQDNYGHLHGKALLTATIEENVLVQLESLRTLPSVASRLVMGDLHLHGWVYKIETGDVFAYNVDSEQFESVKKHQVARLESDRTEMI